MIELIDLFSGSGGFSVAADQCGIKTTAFVENDPECVEILEHHWPGTPIFGNIEGVGHNHIYDGEDYLYECDDEGDVIRDVQCSNTKIIAGGFPCQDISTGNVKGEGIDGTRSGLWKEYKRLISEVRPKWVVIENVANLRSRGLSSVLKDLREIGYDARWDIIPACAIGAGHRRERIWIVCTTNGDLHRLWPSFTTEEERWKWWAETASRFSNVFDKRRAFEPTVLRGGYGLLSGLDTTTKRSGKAEKLRRRINQLCKAIDDIRKRRVKQMGNAIVPQIARVIFERILDQERL